MWVHNSIPANIKPSPRAAKIHYADAFDNDFSFLLRERKSNTLLGMFTNALEVEANMMACGKIKPRADIDRRKGREEAHPSTFASSSSDIKFELMLKTMEKLMDRLIVEARPVNQEQNEPQIRNPNFRRQVPPPLPSNKPRDVRNLRNLEERPIRPLFPKNYVAA